MTRRTVAVLALLVAALGGERVWTPTPGPTDVRLRGVSAVSRDVAWASGQAGTVLRTTDGGATWSSVGPGGTSAFDFRDIEAFDARTAIVLAIGPGDRSRIYLTQDGGATWTLTFVNTDGRRFFDALAFWDRANGLAVGDPVDGRFVLVRTTDGGRSWEPLVPSRLPESLDGDGAFAASGTCLVTAGMTHAWFATGGGARARVFRTADRGETWDVAETPVAAGTASSGIFSVAFRDERHGVVVGGDYRRETDGGAFVAMTTDGGVTWAASGVGRVPGFRSSVVFLPGARGDQLVVGGPSGIEHSVDGGRTWMASGPPGHHALSVAPDGTVWAVGEGGRLAVWR